VFNAGGRVRVTADGGGDVTVEGNATFEWRGEIEVDPAKETAEGLEIVERYDAEVAAWDAVVAGMDVPERSDRPHPNPSPEGEGLEASEPSAPRRVGGISWDGFAVTPGSMRKE
jgi:hypothetical protein